MLNSKSIRKILLWTKLYILVSCGVQDINTHYLSIKMIGVYEEPEQKNTAEQLFEPISQSYELKGIFLTGTSDTDGTQTYEFFNSSTSQDSNIFRITNRMQKIFKKKMEDVFYNMTVSQVKIVFSNKIIGVTKHNPDCEIPLSPDLGIDGDYSLIYPNVFKTNKGQGLEFTIKIKWKNTVIREGSGEDAVDTMTPPELVISYQAS